MATDAALLDTRLRATRPAALFSLASRGVVVAAFAAAAIAWLAASILAIVNFAFRYPAYDQYRLYPTYLDVPFPTSAIQSENGHHPIVPILVRLADNAWAAGSQHLMLGIGTLALLGVLAVIVFVVVRERRVPATTRAAAVLLSVIALLWLGNARILIHGNEQGQNYYTLLATVLALLATLRERRLRNGAWLAVAGFLCVCATFSFGNGLASFAAVFALAALHRPNLRHLALFAGLAATTLWIYLFVLPGDSTVRSALAFDPLTSASTLMRWLSSPWMRSFLGTATPPLDGSLSAMLDRSLLGRALLGTANTTASIFGDDWATREGIAIGAIGLCGYAFIAFDAWRHRATLGRARGFAFGFATFALAAAVIVCLGRLTYFARQPDQILADRYSPWTCVFWLSLALYAMTGPRSGLARQRVLAAVATAAVALAFAPSQSMYAGWCAAAYRFVQQSAVAVQLGILDPDRNADVGSATLADTLATVKSFRAHHIAMFAEPAYALIDSGWRAPAARPAELAGAYVHVTREFDDLSASRHVAAIEGWLPSHVAGLPRDPILAVVDTQGSIRGLAKISFDHSGKSSLRYRVIRKRGFDGYVLDPEPGEVLTLLVMRKRDRGLLASIPVPIPDAAMPAAAAK